MLLRRITEHIKNQNWFAVFLDFVIVVAGVFIGIQVANWNAAVAGEKRAKLLLSRIYDDLNNDLLGIGDASISFEDLVFTKTELGTIVSADGRDLVFLKDIASSDLQPSHFLV